jgi:acyl-CoA synthetase (AMP-forming)/AMP-acid ligase II
VPPQIEQLRWMAEHHPEELAYVRLDTDDTLTFAEWEHRANRLARGLQGLGVGLGDLVAIHLAGEHVLEWITAYVAVHKVGAVAVPTNTRLSADELATVLGHAEPVAVLTSPLTRAPLEEARTRLPSVQHVIEVTDAGLEPWLHDDDSHLQADIDDESLADIMYTSGTTGVPKGIAVRHGNLSIIANNEPEWSGAAWIHASPLFTFAGISFVYNPMKMGMTCLYMPRFDTGAWFEAVEARRPSMAFLVPSTAQLIATHERFDRAEMSSLELVAIGSAPLPPSLHRRLADRLPQATVSNNYSMTEAGTAFTFLPREELDRRAGSVGIPLGTEIRIADPQGAELEPGEIGEVLIRVGERHREYYKDPDATAGTWTGEWLRSGDLGWMDADGYLYITGRAKDVIIRGGNNVHAVDVETVLYRHDAVAEAAVAPVPHEVLGEDVGAWVVVRPGHELSAEELIAFCREHLADYKCPRVVTFMDALPRNPTGKVLKRELPPVS